MTPPIAVPIRLVRPNSVVPVAAHHGDAGLDLCAAVGALLAPGGGRALVPTGISIAIPLGHGGFVLPRSGLAAKHGVTVLNAPGLIDAGYRGEVMVPLVNTDPLRSYEVQAGDRIAQLLVLPVPDVQWQPVDELPPDDAATDDTATDNVRVRGDGGHGSSGR